MSVATLPEPVTEIPAVPPGQKLLPFQSEGVDFARERDAILFADDMGLGKTVQAIGVLNIRQARRILIICPSSLKLNWKDELGKWMIDQTLTIGVADGSDWPDTDIVIINYDILDRFKKKQLKTCYDVAIMDEAHYIKNRNAKRSKAARKVKASTRVALSGTPMENKPSEAWAILDWLQPGAWGTYYDFIFDYCGAIKYPKATITDTPGPHLKVLQDRLRSTVMVRRLKRDVLKDLPPKVRQVIELEHNSDTLITKELEDFSERARRLAYVHAQVILTRCTMSDTEHHGAIGMLREAGMKAFGSLVKKMKETTMIKLPTCLEYIASCIEQGGKVIVFGRHHEVMDAIDEKFGDTCVIIDGRVPHEKRHERVKRFQEDDTCRLFGGTIRAAGEGLTLTAASHVIFVEEDWVPAKVTQAEDRAHRIGQKDSVLVQHLVLEGSTDALMAKAVVRKQQHVEMALNLDGDEDMKGDDEFVIPPQAYGCRYPHFDMTRGEINAIASRLRPDDHGVLIKGMKALSCLSKEEDVHPVDMALLQNVATRDYLNSQQAALVLGLAKKYVHFIPEMSSAITDITQRAIIE